MPSPSGRNEPSQRHCTMITDFSNTFAALKSSGRFFAPGRPIYYSRAPGRLDLMGGNVDYTGGLVFESTIREATWAAVQRRSDQQIVFWNPQMKEEGWLERVEFELHKLPSEEAVKLLVDASPHVRWTYYVFGAFF